MMTGSVRIDVGDAVLEGDLQFANGGGLVIFVHGSGSSRFSPRNRFVASELRKSGLSTLLTDLLTSEEERVDRQIAIRRFDIPFLAKRVSGILDWVKSGPRTGSLTVGLFGSSTGAAAAIVAAAERPGDVSALVSRGGRVDLASSHLPRLRAPILLIVGENDPTVLEYNLRAVERINAVKRIELIPGASHLFEEPGGLEKVAALAARWFSANLGRMNGQLHSNGIMSKDVHAGR